MRAKPHFSPSNKTNQYFRYVNNVIRSFEPSRHFWIGLVKHDNGSKIWEDNQLLLDGDLERFPSSQTRKMTNG